MNSAVYDIRMVDHVEQGIWIVDRCNDFHSKSVTNDAEDVCERLNALHPGYRIFYKDSDGNWDELVHTRGRFRDFKPARDLARKLGL